METTDRNADQNMEQSTDLNMAQDADQSMDQNAEQNVDQNTEQDADQSMDQNADQNVDQNMAQDADQSMDQNADQNVAPEQLPGALEAILFAMGDAVQVKTLAAALQAPEETVREAADLLSQNLAGRGSGLMLNWYEDSLQLSTKPELSGYLIRIASEPKKPKLTPTLMETLSIIAFRQPVTRIEVENIRGVNSDFAINRLVSFDLVQEVGRKEIPGRPLLFGTTQQFLRSFGIRSVEELPRPDELQMEAFREEAEDEVSTSLNV